MLLILQIHTYYVTYLTFGHISENGIFYLFDCGRNSNIDTDNIDLDEYLLENQYNVSIIKIRLRLITPSNKISK